MGCLDGYLGRDHEALADPIQHHCSEIDQFQHGLLLESELQELQSHGGENPQRARCGYETLLTVLRRNNPTRLRCRNVTV